MAKPKFEDREEMELAYIEVRGPYDKVPWDEIIPQLYGWAKEQRVMPGMHPMGIYLDDPKQVPATNMRSWVGITYKGNAKAAGDVKLTHYPRMKVAAYSFKGPSSEYQGTYDMLDQWIREKGHRVSGPSIEVYSKRPEVVGDITILYSKILIPVEPL